MIASIWLAFVAGICAAAAIVLGIYWLLVVRRHPKPKKSKAKGPNGDLHKVDDEGFAPLAIDPSNPPTWRFYRPKSDNTAARRTCHCHNEPILIDQRILWWPLPDGSVRLLCDKAQMKGVETPGGGA